METETYYDKVFSISKFWEGYGIPISFIDPITSIRIEGFIYSPKKRVPGNKLIVSVYRAFDSQYLDNPVKVPYSTILPSRRKLTRMNNFNVVETTVVEHIEEPLPAVPLFEVKRIYDAYKGVKWTARELAITLNRPNDYEIIGKLPFLVKSTPRLCRISCEIEDTYDFSPPEKIVEQEKKFFSITSLMEEYKGCKKCSLYTERASRGYDITPGRGNKVNPKIFIIGESPGTTERDSGIVFNPSAPAGQDLYKVMTAAKIDQDRDCYITNSILCWPPPDEGAAVANGKPKDEHISACNSRLKMELAILKPKVIVLLGSYAYKAFYGKFLKGLMAKNIGWIPTSGNFSVFLTFHPSFIARQLSYEDNPEKRALLKNSYLDNFIEIKRVADGN